MNVPNIDYLQHKKNNLFVTMEPRFTRIECTRDEIGFTNSVPGLHAKLGLN